MFIAAFLMAGSTCEQKKVFNSSYVLECFQKKFSVCCCWALHLFWANSNESALLKKFQGGYFVVLPYIKIIFPKSKVFVLSVKSIGAAHTSEKSSIQAMKGMRGNIESGVFWYYFPGIKSMWMKFLLPDLYWCLIQMDSTAGNYHDSLCVSAMPCTIHGVPISVLKSIKNVFNRYFLYIITGEENHCNKNLRQFSPVKTESIFTTSSPVKTTENQSVMGTLCFWCISSFCSHWSKTQ